ncbi:MAG: type II toxin-antitoxin system RelE/ParE family toxin [Candidatus Kerfeldbacteria bacterium]|nr:type II toxin-antitoxin system RelE/ParE family toxin [Candidatus Kerfeldbacteria bacterium]
MYEVVVKKSAHKNLKKIDNRYRKRILSALCVLETEPYLGKPLKGEFAGFYSLRVWPYRIIYTVYAQKLMVFVIDINHRQGVYA